MSLPDLIRRWQYGWGLARELAPAKDVFDPDGLEVTLGLPGRYREFFPFDEADAFPFAERVAAADKPSWVGVIGHDPAAAVRAFAAAGLEQRGTHDSLMSIELAAHPVHTAPAGYTVRDSFSNSVITVEVATTGGDPAARGLMGLHGTDAIAHAIVTEPAHRRRGLGSVVMSALSTKAVELGATTGLLVAVPEGRHLYTKLGWDNRADFVTGALPTG